MAFILLFAALILPSSSLTFTLGPERSQPYPSPHPYQFPDAALALLPGRTPGTQLMFWSDGATFRVEGPGSPFPATTPSPPTPVLASGPKGTYDANGNWFLAAFRAAPNSSRLVAFTHVEDHGFDCPGSYAEWNAAAVVTSEDDGVTWARRGLAIGDPKPCVPAFGGAGYSSVLPLRSGPGFQGYGGCTGFRSQDPQGLPGTWLRYKGGTFSSPGVNGSSDCLPGMPKNVCCPIVHYNTFLQAYVAVYDLWGKPGTLYIATSADGVAWGQGQLLLQAAENRSLAYGQVLGEGGTGEAGQVAVLAYAAAPPTGSEPRDFIYRSITFD